MFNTYFGNVAQSLHSFQRSRNLLYNQGMCIKSAEATSMKIIERMKKSFRLKEILDFSVS